MSAVYAHGTAPFSRIHATATDVSRPPEKAIPTRSPTGREASTLVMDEIICTRLHDHATHSPAAPPFPSRLRPLLAVIRPTTLPLRLRGPQARFRSGPGGHRPARSGLVGHGAGTRNPLRPERRPRRSPLRPERQARRAPNADPAPKAAARTGPRGECGY